MKNKENDPDEGSQRRLPARGRTTFVYLAHCHSSPKVNYYSHNLLPLFRSVLFNTLFVALLEVDSTQTAFCQHEEWRNIGLKNVPVVDLVVDEKKSILHETNTASTTIYAVTPTNVYVSSGDTSWHVLNDISFSQDISCFDYATTSTYGILCACRYGLMQSFPLGSEWNIIGQASPIDRSVISVSVARSNPDMMFAVLSNDGPAAGDDELVKTTDSGETWFSVQTLPRYEYFISLHSVYVDPQHSNTVYATCDQAGVPWVIKSTDGGTRWFEIEHEKGLDEITDLYFDPTNSNIIYFIGGTVHRRAIYKSIDGLRTYNVKKECDRVYTLSISPTHRKIFYALALPHTVYCSTDAGETWTTLSMTGIDSSCVALTVAVDSHNTIYLGTAEHGIFMSERKRSKPAVSVKALSGITPVSFESIRQQKQQ